MKRSHTYRHVIAVLIILLIAVLIGFAFDGSVTLVERMTHPTTYSTMVEKYAARYDIPVATVYAVIKCESGFDAAAVSDVGAIGLMQLMPSTFEWLCSLTGDTYEPALLYDPDTNVRYGTYLLSILYTKYGRWDNAYAAYNAGMGNVNKWLKDPEYADGNGGLASIPFKETREFVSRVTEARAVYERLYGIPKK